VTKFCMSVDIQDIIKCATSCDDRLRGLGVPRGRISRFPIDLRRRPYNTLALPCESMITLRAKPSGAVYCYRSCLFATGVTTTTKLRAPNWVSSSLIFGHPAPPGMGSAVKRKFLAPSYYSQRAVFASLRALFSLQ